MAEQEGTDPREARRRLIRGSLEDESFREELLRDPKAALELELGTPLPEDVEVRVVEDTHDTVCRVIPAGGYARATVYSSVWRCVGFGRREWPSESRAWRVMQNLSFASSPSSAPSLVTLSEQEDERGL